MFFQLWKRKAASTAGIFLGRIMKSLCRKCWINGSKDNEKRNLDITKGNELSPDRIKVLIKLVHPDRHQGPLAQLAHDTTCWLNRNANKKQAA